MAAEDRRLDISFELIPETKQEPFTKHFPNYDGLVRGNPGDFVLTPIYAQNANELHNFKPRPDDVWIVTFPKCGTTWTQEMVWMLLNNCDAVKAKEVPLTARAPFLELTRFDDGSKVPIEIKQKMPPTAILSLEDIEKMPSPRVIKTHLPFYLLNPHLLDTCKVVYVARNPKDVMVSYYYHHKNIEILGCEGTVQDFAEHFIKEQVWYSPFFPHLIEAWNKRSHPNLLFLFYEDMKKDLRGEIEKVASFLGKTVDENQLRRLENHLHFDSLSKNDAVNFQHVKEAGFMKSDSQFMRKGTVGDWKNYFEGDLNRRIDEWIERNTAGTDLKLTYE